MDFASTVMSRGRLFLLERFGILLLSLGWSVKTSAKMDGAVTPRTIAKILTDYFLENGNFADAGGPMSLQPTPAGTGQQRVYDEDAPAFAGLSVQGVAYEDRGEEETCPGVHVYLNRGSQRLIKSLPKSVDNVPVLVHNMGKLYVKPHAASAATNLGKLYIHDDRIACGSSCAPTGKNYAGTFGALGRLESTGPLYALSNNHVIGDCNHLPIGMPILSPASTDGRPGIRAPAEICRHSQISELRSGAPTLVSPCKEDVAIAEVANEGVVSSWQGDDATGYDTPTDIIASHSGQRVKKFGRTTGLTHGIMEAALLRLDIPYDSDFFHALVWFQGVWAVRSTSSEPFALGGDSGSLIVTEDGQHAVGLVFAASANGTRTFAVPIDRVHAAFSGFELISGHGI